MIPTSLEDIAGATGGRLGGDASPDARVTGAVVVDSRRVERGGLFVCVRGERVDGHDFAGAAVAAGAAAVLAEREVDAPAVVVADTQEALGRLATSVLAASSAQVVGVTGSTGKTSTKDLLATVFGAANETVAPEGSFNNEYGLPLTVLRITPSTKTLVLEYSARGPGHIAYLCRIAPPRVGIVLNVGDAHLGEFGSREAIAKAKGELVEALPADGAAVLNDDDPLVAAMASRTKARVLTFGATSRADVQVADLVVDEMARPSFRLHTPSGSAEVRMRVHGRHHAGNAAAVTAAALAGGLALPEIVAALEHATSRSPHRMDVRERADGLVVIDDAYNANPESMRGALQSMARIAGSRRKWAVFGPMRELGDESVAMHREVGRAIAAAAVAELVCVGPDAAPYAEGAASEAGWSGRSRAVADADEAASLLMAEVAADDVVLVKASNSERLWRVADALTTSAVEVSA